MHLDHSVPRPPMRIDIGMLSGPNFSKIIWIVRAAISLRIVVMKLFRLSTPRNFACLIISNGNLSRWRLSRRAILFPVLSALGGPGRTLFSKI